jgi:hypothetical protein
MIRRRFKSTATTALCAVVASACADSNAGASEHAPCGKPRPHDAGAAPPILRPPAGFPVVGPAPGPPPPGGVADRDAPADLNRSPASSGGLLHSAGGPERSLLVSRAGRGREGGEGSHDLPTWSRNPPFPIRPRPSGAGPRCQETSPPASPDLTLSPGNSLLKGRCGGWCSAASHFSPPDESGCWSELQPACHGPERALRAASAGVRPNNDGLRHPVVVRITVFQHCLMNDDMSSFWHGTR